MSQITLKTSASVEQTASSPLAWLSRAGFGVIILLAIALFGWANPVFLTVDNWANLLQGSAILLIVAMAMTLIVSAGAIDLSVGVALDFGAAFALVALKTWHLPWQAAGLRSARRGADWPAQCLSDPHLPDPSLPRHARHLVYRQQRRAHLYRRRRRDSLSADGSGVSRPGGGQPWWDPHAGSDRAGAVAGGLAGYRAHPVGQILSLIHI